MLLNPSSCLPHCRPMTLSYLQFTVLLLVFSCGLSSWHLMGRQGDCFRKSTLLLSALPPLLTLMPTLTALLVSPLSSLVTLSLIHKLSLRPNTGNHLGWPQGLQRNSHTKSQSPSHWLFHCQRPSLWYHPRHLPLFLFDPVIPLKVYQFWTRNCPFLHIL